MNEILCLLLMIVMVVVVDKLVNCLIKSKPLVAGMFALGIAAVIQIFNTERFPLIREAMARPILKIRWLTITNCSYLLLFTASIIAIVYIIRYIISADPNKSLFQIKKGKECED